MHSSIAYLNGAGETRRGRAGRQLNDKIQLLNTLLAAGTTEPPSVDQRRPTNERQAEVEDEAPTISKPGSFQNDPPDPKNPNEVREQHQRKIRP